MQTVPSIAEKPVLSLITFDTLPSLAPVRRLDFFEAGTRRAKLVRILRAAFVAHPSACEQHQDLWTALVPDTAAIAASETRCKHLLNRYHALEAPLAEESGLSASSVFNAIANKYPLVSNLLRAGL